MPAIYINVPDDLHRELEAIAANEERSITVCASRLIREALKRRAEAVQDEEETRG